MVDPATNVPNLIFTRSQPPKLAIDREVEGRAVSHPAFTVENEADRLNLSYFWSALSANLPARIPGLLRQSGRKRNDLATLGAAGADPIAALGP